MYEEMQTRPLRVEEVERMVASGILKDDEPVQLLDGSLVVDRPQGPVHAGLLSKVRARIERFLSYRWILREEKPLWVSPVSLPEPDLAVVSRTEDFYIARHPRATEVQLVIEVAYTSLELDRRKTTVYAGGGVPECWLVDVQGRRLEVYSEPRLDGWYVTTWMLSAEDSVSTRWGEILVADLLP